MRRRQASETSAPVAASASGAPDVSPIEIPRSKLVDLDGAEPEQTGLCGTRIRAVVSSLTSRTHRSRAMSFSDEGKKIPDRLSVLPSGAQGGLCSVGVIRS